MAMTEKAIRNWEVKQLRQMWQQAKLICGGDNRFRIQFYLDEEIALRGAKREKDRMERISQTMQRSGAAYDKV